MESAYSQGKSEGEYHGFCWGMDRGRFDPPSYPEALKICLTKIPEQYHQAFTDGFKETWPIGVDQGEDYRNSKRRPQDKNDRPVTRKWNNI